METITVFRLEDENGGGCFDVADMQDYTDAAVKGGLMSPEEDAYEHFHTPTRGCPAPYDDLGLQKALAERDLDWDEPGYRFGFSTRQQAAEWFPPCMANALKRNDQTLTIWEVPKGQAAVGDRQVIFNRETARLVERLPVNAIWEAA